MPEARTVLLSLAAVGLFGAGVYVGSSPEAPQPPAIVKKTGDTVTEVDQPDWGSRRDGYRILFFPPKFIDIYPSTQAQTDSDRKASVQNALTDLVEAGCDIKPGPMKEVAGVQVGADRATVKASIAGTVANPTCLVNFGPKG